MTSYKKYVKYVLFSQACSFREVYVSMYRRGMALGCVTDLMYFTVLHSTQFPVVFHLYFASWRQALCFYTSFCFHAISSTETVNLFLAYVDFATSVHRNTVKRTSIQMPSDKINIYVSIVDHTIDHSRAHQCPPGGGIDEWSMVYPVRHPNGSRTSPNILQVSISQLLAWTQQNATSTIWP